MATYHFLALFVIIAACYAEKPVEVVSTFKNNDFVPSMFARFLHSKPVFMTEDQQLKVIPDFNRFLTPDFSAFRYLPIVNENERYEYVDSLGGSFKTLEPVPYPVKKTFEYEVPVTYAPPRVMPVAPMPVYGEPPVLVKTTGSVKPVFDYSMVEDLMKGVENYRNAGNLKYGSYEYMSADGVPVSVKFFEN